jgi:hypothetical protein
VLGVPAHLPGDDRFRSQTQKETDDATAVIDRGPRLRSHTTHPRRGRSVQRHPSIPLFERALGDARNKE